MALNVRDYSPIHMYNDPVNEEFADVTTTDDVIVGDDINITGLATIGETLEVTGDTSLLGNLAVTGTTALAGATTLVAATETVAATNVITAAESGTTFFLSHATEFVSTLPAPAAGLKYSFIVANAPETASYTIVTTSGTDLIHGQVVSAEDAAGSGDSTAGTAADTITFVDSKAVIGDRVDVISDGTSWFAIAYATVQDGITFTAS